MLFLRCCSFTFKYIVKRIRQLFWPFQTQTFSRALRPLNARAGLCFSKTLLCLYTKRQKESHQQDASPLWRSKYLVRFPPDQLSSKGSCKPSSMEPSVSGTVLLEQTKSQAALLGSRFDEAA